jgi:hypothetical protein
LLAVILTLCWIALSGLGVQQKSEYLGSLLVSILAALCLSLLLLQEQRLSDRASDLSTLYLLASTLCDVIILAAPSSIASHAHITRSVLFRCCIHSTLLLLEFCTKRRKELDNYNTSSSPEERHGILSRIFFYMGQSNSSSRVHQHPRQPRFAHSQSVHEAQAHQDSNH